jgi:hypothetical protein
MVKLLSAPSFLLPTVAGLSVAMAGWAVGMDPIVGGFVGLASVAVGVGALATRVIFKLEDLTREAYGEITSATAREAEARLDALHARLEGDRDPRTETTLESLRSTYRELQEQLRRETNLPRAQLLEVSRNADRLFHSCVESLERTLALWQAGQTMSTAEARREAMARRERLLKEIQASADHLAKILDGVRSLGLESRDGQQLAILRGELDESLTVARRVEERMQDIQSELERGGLGEAGAARDKLESQ